MAENFRKRSEYRRPSQMGVPNSKFKGDSDYKLNYLRNEIERKSSNSKPSDQLVPEGTIETSTEKKESFTAHDFKKSPRQKRSNDNLKTEGEFFDVTEARRTYSAHEATRKESKSYPIRPKSNTEAVTISKAPNFEERPSNQEYGHYDVNSVSKAQKLKLDDNLKPLKGNMNEHDSENRVNYRPHDNISRPDKAKSREDYIGLPKDAKMDEDTETRKTFVKYDVGKPDKARPRKDVVGLPDGRIEDSSETKTTFRGHIPSTVPVRERQKNDNLTTNRDEKLTDYTHNKQTFRPHPVEKTERIRHGNTNLALPEGQFEQNTAHREIYKSHDIPRFERVRAGNDKIGLPEGQFEQNTAHREIYKSHDVPRFERVRAGNDTIGLPEGQFEDNTETRNQYLRHSTPTPTKPSRSKYESYVSIRDGEDSKLDGKSEMHEKYSAKYGRRSDQAKPAEQLSIERSKSMSSLNSITSHDYRGGFVPQKPEKVRRGDHLQPNGGIEESRKQYATLNDRPGSLRAKPGWFSDLITPYEGFAEGPPRALGNIVKASA